MKANDNVSADVAGAMDYLLSGGLGEVICFTDLFAKRGEPKVSCDTDMMQAILILASEAADARAKRKDIA